MVAIIESESVSSRPRRRTSSRSPGLAHSQTRGPARESGVSGLRYLQTETGRWTSRDPIEERATTETTGLEYGGKRSLYAFCANDTLDRIDPIGLAWKNLWRDENHSRAPVFREYSTDTIVHLADMVHLDPNEALGPEGWLKTLSGRDVLGPETRMPNCWYSVPNEAHLTMGQADAGLARGAAYTFLVDRKTTIRDVYTKAKYKIVDHDSGDHDGGSRDTILNSIKKDKATNIYVWAHYGHGVPGRRSGSLSTWEGLDYGFVDPDEPKIRYKLAEIVLFTCRAGTRETDWLRLVAPSGVLYSTPENLYPSDFWRPPPERVFRPGAYYKLNKRVR